MAGIHPSARLPDSRPGGPHVPIPKQQQSIHPRRTSPQERQLLSGNKRRKISHSPEKAGNVPALPGRLVGSGSGSDESASHWFDNVNQHVAQTARGSIEYDDEPPFFVSNQNDYRPQNFVPSEGSKLFGVRSRLDSENEDLRGVIDDLTVENKRLKQILRFNQKNQRDSPSTDGQDKLFEVRMHGLTSDKRRELEFLLKNFATSVHTTTPSVPNSSAGSGVSSNGLTHKNGGRAKTDSGYASNSGQPYTLDTSRMPGISRTARDKSIKSYLHDIPDTLMPRRHPMVMSERAKMALVVRRMEQLFTGRNAAPGEHSQPLQQQEVSRMAAQADAKNSRKRKIEGTREAHILPPDSKVNFDAAEFAAEGRKTPDVKTSGSNLSVSETISRPGSPDQRPTRPLDLDIHRAQVATENIQYIRHLGLSSPSLDANESDDTWMYFNLLINMAQLHTVNVTPAFIRKSLKTLSTKFEVSKDGHRVRWIGGTEGTVFSKEEEKALEVADNNKDSNSPEEPHDEIGTGGSSKRSKTDTYSNAMASNTTQSEDKISGLQASHTSKPQTSTGATSYPQSLLPNRPTQSGSAFDYKPIVYRDKSRNPIEEIYLQDSESSPGDTSQDSSGLVHALSSSNLNHQRNSDEGLITFYNNPHFCSDFSGDKTPNNMLPARDVVPGWTIGIHPGDDWEGVASRLADACYFTPQFGPPPFRHVPGQNLPDLTLAPLAQAGEEETQPLEFIASGLGGVIPDDNFAIDTDVCMMKSSAHTGDQLKRHVPFTGTEINPVFAYKTGGSRKIDLLPSRLPPPSYVFFQSSSSSGTQMDEDDSTYESDETSTSAEDHIPPPPSFLQHRSANEYMESEDDENEDHDDSSMDMLAVARAADPIRIAEQERQYIINQPGGRVVAGSLAATVGASHSAGSDELGYDNDIDSDKAEVVSEGDGGDEDDYDSESDSDMEVDQN